MTQLVEKQSSGGDQMGNSRSFLVLVAGLIGLTTATNSFGSALVLLDRDAGLATVQGKIIFYGPQATEDVAYSAATEVQTYWNGGTDSYPATQYLSTMIEGKSYQVIFDISYQLVSDETAKDMMATSPGPELTFIQILQGNAANGDRSYMSDLGANTGVWYLSDDIGKSTTVAHEFGHGMGLAHPVKSDWRGRGQPDIMSPRGTIVDADYQWNVNAAAGAAGGTISPYKRRVIQWDINNLQLSQLNFGYGTSAALNRPLAETPWSNEMSNWTGFSLEYHFAPSVGRVY